MTATNPGTQTDAFNVLVWISGIISAFIIQFIVRLLVTRADGLKARIDELCEAVNTLSSASHEYWSLSADDPGLTKAEANLSAANHTTNCLSGILFEMKPKLKDKLFDAIFNLTNEATGSNFQVHNRAADPYRYRTVQGRAMIIVGDMRRFQQRFLSRTIG